MLTATKALSAFIAPFLLVAFVILYGFPGETARLWSWQIQSHMTSMLLASAYLGGCYFFLRVLLVERRWAEVRAGFVSVALFASLLGIAGKPTAATRWRGRLRVTGSGLKRCRTPVGSAPSSPRQSSDGRCNPPHAEQAHRPPCGKVNLHDHRSNNPQRQE
ncbi:hypothetical protein ASG95_13285 [Phycicoccus sp. Soil803]|nr:hypothetical protein ASG95_13285 [Phycicoccus sp. Soil803]